MTDDVADLVLANNEAQTLALVIARRQALPMVNVHARYVDVLEAEGWLDRALEFLPTDKQIAERQAAGAGLQAPELAVLIAYTKNANVAEVVKTDLPDVAVLEADLVGYFPPALRTTYAGRDPRPSAAPRDRRHPARQPDGQPVGHLVRPPHDRGHGRLGRRRDAGVGRRPGGARLPQRCGPRSTRSTGQVALDVQLDLFLDCRQMAERATLWLLRHRRPPIDIAAAIAQFGPGLAELSRVLEPVLVGRMADLVRSGEASRLTAGVPERLAERATVWPLLHTGFDLVEIAAAHDRPIGDVAAVEWTMFDRLDLPWLWDGIGALPRADRWQTQARSAVRDDLLIGARRADRHRIDSAGGSVDAWLEANERSVGPRPGDVHRDPARRQLRPDHAVGGPAPAAQPGPDQRDLVGRTSASVA